MWSLTHSVSTQEKELELLAHLQQLAPQYRTRPSLLGPLSSMAAFGVGALSSCLPPNLQTAISGMLRLGGRAITFRTCTLPVAGGQNRLASEAPVHAPGLIDGGKLQELRRVGWVWASSVLFNCVTVAAIHCSAAADKGKGEAHRSPPREKHAAFVLTYVRKLSCNHTPVMQCYTWLHLAHVGCASEAAHLWQRE